MKFFLTTKKVNKPKSLLETVISGGSCSARCIAKIAGTVISCALAVGAISRLLTRQMYFTIESRLSWDSLVRITPALVEELRFWFTNIDCFNGYRINAPPTSCVVLFSDASDFAFGVYSATINGSMVSALIEHLGCSSIRGGGQEHFKAKKYSMKEQKTLKGINDVNTTL